MTSWSNREELVHRIVTLAREKVSRRAIAISLRISRNTVRQVLQEHGEQRETEHSALPRPATRAPRVSKLDPYKDRVSELLDKYADITAQRIFEILRTEGFDGGSTAVKKYVRRIRPKPKRKPSLQTPVYGPGKMAESDWSPYVLTFTDGTKQEIQLFGYTLVHSTRKFYRGYTSYGTHALMEGHVAAFEHLQGAASSCKYDGQKAVVLRWEGRQPIYNPQFGLALCAQAFHWLDARQRLPKFAAAMQSKGVLAIFGNVPSVSYGVLRTELDAIYDINAPALRRRPEQNWYASADSPITVELEASPDFSSVEFRAFHWQRSLDAETYCKLLSTYSDHSTLDDSTRTALLAAVANAIQCHGSFVTLDSTTGLFLARKLG